MGAVAVLLLMLAAARADWDTNSLVSVSRSLARGENLTDCWICHSNPLAGGHQLTFVPFEGNVTLTLLREGDSPNRGPLAVNLPPAASLPSLPCVHLNPPSALSTQPPLPKVTVPLRCYRESASCCHCSLHKPSRPACVQPREQGVRALDVSAVTPLFDRVPCSHNLTHWCPSSPAADGRCLPWSGSTPRALPGSACARSPPWGPQLQAWLRRGADHLACAPPGFAFLCDTRNSTLAHACLGSASKSSQTCVLARVELGGAGPAVRQGALARPARDGALVLEGLRAATGLAVSGTGRASREATLGNLATALRDLAGTVFELQSSADSLESVIRDNKLALDYLLAEQWGVCVLVNTTCCTYVNGQGEVETDTETLSELASRLRQDDQHPGARWAEATAWLPLVLSLLVTLLLILVFGLFLVRTAVKVVDLTIQQLQKESMVAHKYKPLLG